MKGDSMFITLTDGDVFYVNTDYIMYYEPSSNGRGVVNGAQITLSNGEKLYTEETIEQIAWLIREKEKGIQEERLKNIRMLEEEERKRMEEEREKLIQKFKELMEEEEVDLNVC